MGNKFLKLLTLAHFQGSGDKTVKSSLGGKWRNNEPIVFMTNMILKGGLSGIFHDIWRKHQNVLFFQCICSKGDNPRELKAWKIHWIWVYPSNFIQFPTNEKNNLLHVNDAIHLCASFAHHINGRDQFSAGILQNRRSLKWDLVTEHQPLMEIYLQVTILVYI